MIVCTKHMFSSAHCLDKYDGVCQQIHGHNYVLEVSINGSVDPKTGMVMDFIVLEQLVDKHIISILDHRNLSEIIDCPTAENISIWIWDTLKPVLPRLEEIVLHETPQYCVVYRGE